MSALPVREPGSAGFQAVTVPSRSEPGVEHRVWPERGAWRCSCAGFYFRRRCAHVHMMPPLPMAGAPEEIPMSVTALTPVRSGIEPTHRSPSPLPEASQWQMILSIADTLRKATGMPRHIATTEAAAAAILLGHELGIGPMHAITSIYLLEGRFAIAASLMAGLIARDCGPAAMRIVETTDAKCVVEAQRPGWPAPTRLIFTIDMARQAGLADRDNWKRYPAAMLRARAQAAAARAYFSDVIHGLHSPEELGAPVTVTPEGEVIVVEAELAPPKQPAPAGPSIPPISAEQISGKPAPTPAARSSMARPDMTAWWKAVREAGWDSEIIQQAAQASYGRAVQHLDGDQLNELRDAALNGRVQASAEGEWRVVPVGDGEPITGERDGQTN